mgnify:CR=1 FL=1
MGAELCIRDRRLGAGGGAAPRGAHFTECPPDYGRDEAFQREYAATAKNPEAWTAFRERYVDAPGHDAYLAAVDAREGSGS